MIPCPRRDATIPEPPWPTSPDNADPYGGVNQTTHDNERRWTAVVDYAGTKGGLPAKR